MSAFSGHTRSPISRPQKERLTFAWRLTILHTMRHAFRIVAALRSALAGRRDLMLEYVALRHQLGVLARSDRRFQRSDRLLWLCLRRWGLRWNDALIFVQPATVARWHRKGFRGCWRSRRRTGRPRIDSELQALIRRMRTEPVLD